MSGDFRNDRFRPQDTDGGGADPGRVPSDDGDRIMHPMAAVNQGSDEQHSSEQDDPEECPDGAEADALYEAHGRSLQKLSYFARQSSLPSSHPLATGLALAQELLVEELANRSVFESPRVVTDFLKLHFAGRTRASRCSTWTRDMRSLRSRKCFGAR
jgi:hypothetical protein